MSWLTTCTSSGTAPAQEHRPAPDRDPSTTRPPTHSVLAAWTPGVMGAWLLHNARSALHALWSARKPSRVWLPAYVVQGIQYILSFAKPYVTRRVIINLSYGPTTGPHDGLAELEMALTALVADYDGSGGRPKLEIFLAAGNS